MEIPSRIRALLQDDNLYGAVTASLSEFEPWLTSERPEFFPEYTNHGISHIEAVFQTAEALMSEQSWEVFTPSDAATMLLAILLHDSAMHLTPDSFVALLNNCAADYRIEGLDKWSWTELWDNFLAEASRFDGRKLNALFGSPDPVYPPLLDPEKMTGRDKKIIGEFLRRHHHTLAHQIACFGVPGPTPNRLTLQNVPADIADLAGLAARSHGMPLRPCIDYLNEKYNNKCEHQGVHTAFIMALLRVADYLQIQAERAPKQILKITALRSPISRGHYDLHNAIRDVRITHIDPEAIDVNATPTDVDTFLRTRKLLDDIQTELDSSWAVLGEVYGRMESNKLHLLGLKYRRIRSNLDDIDAFAKTVDYIPCHAAFEAAGADLLKLLIKPLYGDDPSFGIRELIQNAVDAVRELQEYQKSHNLKNLDLPDQEADVVVSFDKNDNGELWLTVSDCGIGMTAETIRNYFLRAGASFRESDAWRREFTDEKAKSRVLRSGRFGIGALAAFLIGDEIEVETRHVTVPKDQAIEFKASLDAETIDLKGTQRPIGTEIRIKILKELLKKYDDEPTHTYSDKKSWREVMDWYYISKPSLVCKINGKKVTPSYALPNPSTKLPPNWHSIKPPNFQEIHWTHSKEIPDLTCNGIRIRGVRYRSIWSKGDRLILHTPLFKPKLSVFDPDGQLPLDLTRTEMAGSLPFYDELCQDILKDLLAFILLTAPCAQVTNRSAQNSFWGVKYPGGEFTPISCSRSSLRLLPWSSTDRGALFMENWNIHEAKLRSAILVVRSQAKTNSKLRLKPNNTYFVFQPWWEKNPHAWMHFARFACRYYYGTTSGLWDTPFHQLLIAGSRILLPAHKAKVINRPRGLRRAAREQIRQQKIKGNRWVLWQLGNCPEPTSGFIHLMKQVISQNPKRCNYKLAEWYLAPEQPEIPSEVSPIVKVWKEIIREPIIPYDPGERRKKLAHAFEALAPYIEAHEELLRQQQEEKKKSDK